jgi:hypothetical protein
VKGAPTGGRPLAAGLMLGLCLVACGGGNTPPATATPGAPASAKTRALDAGAAALQDRPPIDALNAYLNGFHFYAGRKPEDPAAQMEAHHFCANVNNEVRQCAIYDGNTRNARLMGVEYIISRRLFEGLPAAEKPLWHSHVHEVTSGQLLAPGIPQTAEHALMRQLVDTYGKTWHTWHTDRADPLPLGVPQLMMGFTADGQLDPGLVAERDGRLGITSMERRRLRSDIGAPAVAPGADAWQHGRAVQLADPTGQAHAAHRKAAAR